MERIAIISDIHGNLPALEATLDDIRARGVTRIMCLGDLVGKGPDSAAAVDICRDVCEATVRGNWDEFICNPTTEPTLQWHQQRLGPERLAYLAALPNTLEFVISGKRVRLFHASHDSVFHRIYMQDKYENQRALFSNTPFTGDTAAPDVVGYGDIHTTYLKTFGHQTLFNVGSVGNPLDFPQAAYVLLEGEFGNATASAFGVQFMRVPYDIERAVEDAERVNMPELQAYANELRTARYRGLSPA